MTAQKTNVAVVQAAPVAFDTLKTLEKVAAKTREAAALGAQLVLFPEAFVGAYPRGLSFGANVGNRTPEGRDQYRRYWESAIDVPGSGTARLGQIAAEHRIYLVIGVIERDGGTLYCTVLFFGPDGGYLGKHRKLMPTESERLIWGYGDGSTMPVFETPLGKYAIPTRVVGFTLARPVTEFRRCALRWWLRLPQLGIKCTLWHSAATVPL